MIAITCYKDGDKIKTLDGLIKKYKGELEEAYHRLYDEDEWKVLVETYSTEIEEYNDDSDVTHGDELVVEAIFPEKPAFDKFFNYNNNGVFPFEEIKPKLDSVKPFDLKDDEFRRLYAALIESIGIAQNKNKDNNLDDFILVMQEAFDYVRVGFLDDNLDDYGRKVASYDDRVREEALKAPWKKIPGHSAPQDIASSFNSVLEKLGKNVEGRVREAEGLCIEDVDGFLQAAARKLFTHQIENKIAEIEAVDPKEYTGSGGTAQMQAAKARARTRQGLIDKLEARKKALEAAIGAAEASEVIYQEQCFLLANIADLVEFKKASPDDFLLPYVVPSDTGDPPSPSEAIKPKNHPIHIQGDAFAFTNKLAVHPTQQELFRLTQAELSSLTPHMRFFKVESDQDGKDTEQEIKFDSNASNDLIEYMNGAKAKKGGRGLGVGVKSFSFSYDGTDPFSVKKAISAKLSIYAPSFSELLRDRGGYKYVDLALKTGTYKTKEQKEAEANIETLTDIERENLDKLNFRIKVLVEWTASKQQTKIIGTQKKRALYDSAISVYLTPTIHEFDFDDAGGVTFSINYLAYIEDYFAQPSFDVFGQITAEKKARDLTYEYLRQSDCDYGGIDFSGFREQEEAYISRINTYSLQKIIRTLRLNKAIYYLSIGKKDMREWLKNPYDNTSYITADRINSTPSVNEQMVSEATKAATRKKGDKADQSAFSFSLISNSDLQTNTAFFYLSDLIDAAMSNIEDSLEVTTKISDTNYVSGVLKSGFKGADLIEEYITKKSAKKSKNLATIEQFKKIRVVLGPMEITPYAKSQSSKRAISCTIGDIPISLAYFLDFMSEKVLSKNFIQYPFSKFVKDIVNDCIRNFINADGCFASNASQKVSLNSTTVLAYNVIESEAAQDDLSNLILQGDGEYSEKNCLLSNKVPTTRFPILKISGPNEDPRKTLGVDTMRNYFIFSIGRRYPTDLYAGDRQQDSESGIFHYVLGDNKGIVKSISLDKTDTPGLKELRFEQEGFDGLEQLREVYNANITTFLNPQTFPGTYIYVEPRGFDPTATEDLTRFGIGGYYMITKTQHTIQPGNAETVLNAAWVASKGGKPAKNQGGQFTRNEEEGSPEKHKKCRVKALKSTGDTR